jgi:hypothetical protein
VTCTCDKLSIELSTNGKLISNTLLWIITKFSNLKVFAFFDDKKLSPQKQNTCKKPIFNPTSHLQHQNTYWCHSLCFCTLFYFLVSLHCKNSFWSCKNCFHTFLHFLTLHYFVMDIIHACTLSKGKMVRLEDETISNMFQLFIIIKVNKFDSISH